MKRQFHPTHIFAGLALLAATGCPGDDDVSVTGDGSSGEATDTGGDDLPGDTLPTPDPTTGADDTDTGMADTDTGVADTGMTDDGDSSSGGDTCGDGVLDADEDCDGEELDGEDCQSQGFDSGNLVCNADCTFDTSACIVDPVCGDDTVNGDDVCDGDDLDGEDCASQGFDGGDLTCLKDCTGFDTSACTFDAVCGDDMVGGAEACDGADLGGEDCVSQGFDGGALSCLDDCTALDTSACVDAVCGDDMAEAPEDCDGADLAGEDCVSQGFGPGPLACAGDCTFDTSACAPAPCEDEDIGGATGPAVTMGDLNVADDDLPQSCAGGGGLDHVVLFTAPGPGVFTFDTFGSDYDTALALFASCDVMSEISCNDDAVGLQSELALDMAAGEEVRIAIGGFNAAAGNYILNITPPVAGGVCGNGAVEGMEACDGADFAGEDCISQGFDGGALACAVDCTIDTAGCFVGSDCCVANGTPGCDDAACEASICGADAFCCDNQWDQVCADAAVADPACGAACGGGGACGDDMIDGMEVCDGVDLGGEDCISQGFDAGVLACLGDCTDFDTSACAVASCEQEDIGTNTGSPVTMGNTDASVDTLPQSCGAGGGADHVVLFTATLAGDYTFDTFGSGYDTALSIHGDCGGASELACNDDAVGLQSEIILGLAAGESVFVSVGGFGGSTGDWILNVTPPALPALPACAEDDLGLFVGPLAIQGDTTGDDDDLAQSCGGVDGVDRVHRWIAPADGNFTFDTGGSAFDTALTLYANDCATELDCNDDSIGLQSSLSRDMTAGEEILIVVEGFSASVGLYDLNITQNP